MNTAAPENPDALAFSAAVGNAWRDVRDEFANCKSSGVW